MPTHIQLKVANMKKKKCRNLSYLKVVTAGISTLCITIRASPMQYCTPTFCLAAPAPICISQSRLSVGEARVAARPSHSLYLGG